MSDDQFGLFIFVGTLWVGGIALILAHIADTLTLIRKAIEKKDE